jgi:hypothetical protein
MSRSSSSSSSYEETSEDLFENEIKRKVKVDAKKKYSNDKGRFENTPLHQVSTMSAEEKKRKRQDKMLAQAEKRSRAVSDERKPKEAKKVSPAKSPRGNSFSEDEIKEILLSISKGKDDNEIFADFLKKFPETTRTKAALKVKIVKTREELTNTLNNLTPADLEAKGLIFSSCFSFLFDFPFISPVIDF